MAAGTVGASALSLVLIVSGAGAAVSWYAQGLGATLLWDLDGVAGLSLDEAPFFLHEGGARQEAGAEPGDAGMTTSRIEVFIDAPDAFIERAARAGPTDVALATDHDVPWGRHRQRGFTDLFGHRWSVGDRGPLRRFPA